MRKYIFIMLLLPFSIFAQENKFEISLTSGVLLPGNIEGSYDLDFPEDRSILIKNISSPIVKLSTDYRLKEYLTFGINLNYAGFKIEDILHEGESIKSGNEVNLGEWDGREHIIPFEGISMIEVNFSVKGHFYINENIQISPCLFGGYRRSFSESIDARENGVVLNAAFECKYYFKNQHFIILDAGLLSQPYGGVDDVGYVRSFGVPNITAGYGISF